MRILFLMALFLRARTKAAADMPPQSPFTDSYPVANFALTVNASAHGDLYGKNSWAKASPVCTTCCVYRNLYTVTARRHPILPDILPGA